MISFPAQVRTIARRDLARERRSGEVLWATLPFGAIALLLIPLGILFAFLYRPSPREGRWVAIVLGGFVLVGLAVQHS